MNFIKKEVTSIIAISLMFFLAFFCLQLAIPSAKPLLKQSKTVAKSNQKELLYFVAIGDSLTEGIGDTTESGGYVPLLKQMIGEETNISAIQSSNFGKSGDRSDQILARIKKSKDIQKELKKADFITLTVGGNDLMKVVKSELMNEISYETFKRPQGKFQKQLAELLKEIRRYNSTAPIYQMGIYNPFYLNFQEMTEMQDIVTLWNDGAEDITLEEKNVYFIPINDLLYKGLDGNIGIGNHSVTEETESSSSAPVSNNLISTVDNFHPNNLGYQIMANSFKEKLMSTASVWLEK